MLSQLFHINFSKRDATILSITVPSLLQLTRASQMSVFGLGYSLARTVGRTLKEVFKRMHSLPPHRNEMRGYSFVVSLLPAHISQDITRLAFYAADVNILAMTSFSAQSRRSLSPLSSFFHRGYATPSGTCSPCPPAAAATQTPAISP